MASLAFFRHPLTITPQLRDHALITLWIFVTFKQFRNDELILYPLALYFLWAFIRDFDQIADLLVRSAILWAFPLWNVLSLAWGAETEQILKTSLQLVLTLIICYCAVVRLRPRHLLLSVLIVAAWFGVLSLIETFGDGVSARGVFKSKNALGIAMVILWVSALGVAFESAFPRLIRLAAVCALPLALVLIQISNSATAVLLALGSTAIMIGLRFISVASVPLLVGILTLVLGGFALAASVVAFNAPVIDPVGQVLGAFGKDATLTGRTLLWDYAKQQIAQDPFLGVGYGGFWHAEDALSTARRIYDEFYKPVHATFSFHNSYYEVAVHQGLIGLAILIASGLWALARILPAAITDRSASANFFACIALILAAQSFTEVVLMVPFNLLFMLFTMGALMTLKPAIPAVVPPQAEPFLIEES